MEIRSADFHVDVNFGSSNELLHWTKAGASDLYMWHGSMKVVDEVGRRLYELHWLLENPGKKESQVFNFSAYLEAPTDIREA